MKKILLAFSLIFGLLEKNPAQENFILYNMDFVPQHLYVNPSAIPSNNLNIGIPVLTSFYAGFGNSGFNLNDLFTPTSTGTNLNIGSVISNLRTNNFLTTNLNVDLLSFGFKLKKNYFSFNLTEKANIWLRYPKAFFNFLWLGNGAPGVIGTTQNFNFAFNASLYQEWGFGFAREINEKLSVGGKLKFLAGIENATSTKSNVTFNTDPNSFAYTASSNIKVNTSVSDTGKGLSPSSYLFNFSNPGIGMDLGATYKYTDRLTFSASLIDLGFISWNTGVTNYQSQNPGASFVYRGLDFNALNTSNTVNGSNFGQKLTDSLQKTFNVTNTSHSHYSTALPAQMYINGTYKLNEINRAGVLLYGQLIDGSLRPAITLSLSSKVGKSLSSMLSYSAFNNSYNIIGFGFSLNAGPVQIYAIADNILALIVYNQYTNSNTGSTAFELPAYTKFFNIRFGINLTLGRNTHDRDHDGVKDKDDECPDVPGPKALRGCPDRDGDGVPDKDDVCPDIAGLPQFHGCPDTDGDGIPDKDDECPTEKGSLITKGCPDADNDSIKDSEDECPNEAGPRALKGCPDRDHDGVADKYDKCPDVPGPVENEGCPIVKLTVTDSLGNLIGVIVKNKSGEFIYEKLLPDGASFKLEGADIALDSLVLIYMGKNQKLIKAKDGNYRFEKIEAPATNPLPAAEPKQPEKVVEVKLKAEEKEVVKTAFSNLEFENGKDVIKEQSYVSLTELAGLLKKKPEWMLRISGHTDNIGDAKSNLDLSKKRAEAVKRFLVLSGLADNRMIIEYFGSSRPLTDNKTPEGRAKNRRVEMTIVQSSR